MDGEDGDAVAAEEGVLRALGLGHETAPAAKARAVHPGLQGEAAVGEGARRRGELGGRGPGGGEVKMVGGYAHADPERHRKAVASLGR